MTSPSEPLVQIFDVALYKIAQMAQLNKRSASALDKK